MVVAIKIIKRDTSLKELRKTYAVLNHSYATAGVHKEEGQKQISKGFRQVDNAVLQEFGGVQRVQKTRRFKVGDVWHSIKKGTIIVTPARVFIRTFLMHKKARDLLSLEMKKQINLVKGNPKNVHKCWYNIGKFASDFMKMRIYSGQIKPALSQFTLTARQEQGITGDKPLYATGQLYKDIKNKVRKK